MDQALGSTSIHYLRSTPKRGCSRRFHIMDHRGTILFHPFPMALSNSHISATCQMHKLDSLSRLREFLDVLGKHWFQKHPEWLSALHGAWDGMTAWDGMSMLLFEVPLCFLVYSTDSAQTVQLLQERDRPCRSSRLAVTFSPGAQVSSSRFKFGPQGTSLNEACRGQDVHRLCLEIMAFSGRSTADPQSIFNII